MKSTDSSTPKNLLLLKETLINRIALIIKSTRCAMGIRGRLWSRAFQGPSGKVRGGQYRRTGAIPRAGRRDASPLLQPLVPLFEEEQLPHLGDLFVFRWVGCGIRKASVMNIFLMMLQKRYPKAWGRVIVSGKAQGVWPECFLPYATYSSACTYRGDLSAARSPRLLLLHRALREGTCQDGCSQRERTEPRTRVVRAENQGLSAATPTRGAPPFPRVPGRTGTGCRAHRTQPAEKTPPKFYFLIFFLQ